MDGGKITLDRETFKVLASDTRLDILKALDVRQKTVTELGRELDLNKATVFEHLEKLQGAGLVDKLEDERKWVYWQLSWKGRRLLHPERITIALLFSSSLAAVVTAVVTAWLYWRGRVVETLAGDDRAFPTSGAQDAATTANAPPEGSREAVDAPAASDGAPGVLEEIVRDPSLLYATVALVALALLLVGVALLVRRQRRSAASSTT